MSLRKRGTVWWIDFVTPSGQRVRRSAETGNRTLALVRAILRRCERDWEWIERAPAVRLLKEPTRRIRYLTRPEADRLLAELSPHLADMARFALATGLRAANITGMQWDQVDLDRRMAWVHPLRFHDLRHTFASWHVQQGTPLSVLQELGGWQSGAMVSRYAHLGAEHLAAWNDRLASYGTNVAQPANDKKTTSAQPRAS
jgi:integrase